MKKIFPPLFLVLLLPVLASTASSSVEGLKVGNQSFSVYTVDPKTQTLGLYWKDPAGKIYSNFRNLETDLKKQGRRVDFATNAGIYEEGAIPTGLLIIEGQDILPLNLNPGRGNFFLRPNGIFLMSKGKPYVMTTEAWLQFKHPIEFANQSGPMLVVDGKIHPAFTEGSDSKFIRSGVGINSKGLITFVLSREKVNLYDFARVFKENLGCKNALYLDGSISKFYTPGTPRLSQAQEYFAAFFAVTSPL